MAKKNSEKGNVMIEFALNVSVMFILLTGIFQLGYAFYIYNALVNAVRNGARYASNVPYSSSTATPDDAYRTKVQNMVVYGVPTPASSMKPLVSGLTLSNVAVTMTGGNAGGLTPPTAVKVSIIGFRAVALFPNVYLDGKPYCLFPYSGILTPAP